MTERDFEHIEKYLLGRLNAVELAAFRQHIDADTDFREQVDVFSTISQGIRQAGRNELRKRVFPPSRIPFMIRLRKWSVGVTATLLIAVGAYFVLSPGQNEKLFREFYAKIDSIHFTRPPGDEESYQIKIDAYQAYKSNRHQDAKEHLAKLDESDPESELLAGLNLLHQEKYSEATLRLLAAKSGPQKISAAASWYLALIYVKEKDNKKALGELRRLVESNSSYKGQAEDLIKKIK